MCYYCNGFFLSFLWNKHFSSWFGYWFNYTTNNTSSSKTTGTPKSSIVGKTKIEKAVKKSAKRVVIRLKRVNGAEGYQISIYSSKKNAKQNTSALVQRKTKKTKVTLASKKIRNIKKLYARARAFKTINKVVNFGSPSAIKRIK